MSLSLRGPSSALLALCALLGAAPSRAQDETPPTPAEPSAADKEDDKEAEKAEEAKTEAKEENLEEQAEAAAEAEANPAAPLPESPPPTPPPPTDDSAKPAVAVFEAPTTRFIYRTRNVVRANPFLVASQNTLGIRRAIGETERPFLDENFFGIGISPQLSASYLRLGLYAEAQPLNFLRLWVGVDAIAYTGFAGALYGATTPSVYLSDTVLWGLQGLPYGDPGGPQATFGSQLTLGADLTLRFGVVAVDNRFKLAQSHVELQEGDTVYYDPDYDIVVADEGIFLNNELDIAYASDFGLFAGLRTTLTHAFYTPANFLERERGLAAAGFNPNGPIVRTGPVVSYTFFDDEGAWLNRPTLLLSAQWFVAHRYRTGADSSPFIPCVTVAFEATGDLLPWGRAR